MRSNGATEYGGNRRNPRALVVVILAMTSLWAFPAVAWPDLRHGCLYRAADETVILALAEGGAALSVGEDGTIDVAYSSSALGTDCAPATVSNTSLVKVLGEEGTRQTITVRNDGRGGPFPTTIAFDIGLQRGIDVATFVGTSGEDHYTTSMEPGHPTSDVVDMDGTFARVRNAPFLVFLLGNGDDTFRASEEARYVEVYGGGGNDRLVGSRQDDALYGDDGDDILRGRAGGHRFMGVRDHLHGGDGNDVVSGGLGPDLVQGGPGDDILDGGHGVDMGYWWSETGPLIVSLDGGTASGPDGDDTLISVQYVYGSPAADTIVGDRLPNHIWGRDGNDSIAGRGGDDKLFGDQGDDELIGGVGSDTANGRQQNDHCFAEHVISCEFP